MVASWLSVGSTAFAEGRSADTARAVVLHPLKSIPRDKCDRYRTRYFDRVKIDRIVAIGFIYRGAPQRYWLELDTTEGCFIGRKPLADAEGAHDAFFGRQVVGNLLLIKWSSGPGTIDPPDSTYTSCEHAFVVCTMDWGRVPLCSDPITVAKVKNCGDAPGHDQLLDDVADAFLAKDGTFEIEGLRFRVRPQAPVVLSPKSWRLER
jgi:hypothetical protein